MISTERVILIKKGEAIINDPIVLYRGDYQVKILFTILEHKFKFKETLNIIEQTKASYAQLAVSLPDGTDLFTDIIETENGSVIFKISKLMIDEIREVGSYSFHIRLFNEDKTSRVTLPPINDGIVIREPLVAEDSHLNSSVEVGYSRVDEAKIASDVESFADASGNLKIVWNKGDIISSTRLNEMVQYINENAVPGKDGLTTSITVNGETYRQLNGNITLPNYPKTSEGGGSQDVDLSAYATTDYVDKEVAKKADINHTHNYLTDIPSEYITETELNEKGYLTEHQSLDNYYNKLEVDQKIANAQLGGEGGGEVDLSSYALKAEIPTKTSDLVNDSNYLTNIPSEYITETELNGKGYLTEHQDISNKANISDLATVAMSGNYDDLTNKPSIPSLDGYATETYVQSIIANSKGSHMYNVLDYDISTDNEDNSQALQTLVDMVNANGGGIIYFPKGVYKFKYTGLNGNHKYAILHKSNVSIVGENIETTILKQTQPEPYSLFYSFNTTTTPITGCTFNNFTVDAYETGEVNKVYGKAFFFQYVKNCVFRDLILKGTIATAMGIDFLDNVHLDNIYCIDCGRTFESEATTSGTSGIGIGTGGWTNENFTITNCKTVRCGQYGIFIENQHTLGWGGNTNDPKGCIISNCITRDGLFRGIGIRGGTNVTVSNCLSYGNAKDGIYLDNKCVNVSINNNITTNNSQHGILVKTMQDSKDINISDNMINNNSYYGIALTTNTNSLYLRDNVIKNNKVSGLYIKTETLHTDTIIKNNVVMDGNNISESMFNGNVAYNDYIQGNVEVVVPKIESITCDNISLNVGKSIKVPYSIAPSSANKELVNITAGNADIIRVEGTTIYAIKEGTTTLTISSIDDPSISTTINVTVKVIEVGEDIEIANSEFIKDQKMAADGTISAGTNCGVTDYIDLSSVSNMGAIRVTFSHFKMSEGGRIILFDENKELISEKTLFSSSTNLITNYIVDLDLNGAHYIRISLNVLSDISCTISESEVKKITIPITDMAANTKIMPDGSITTETNSYTTEYIDVEGEINLTIDYSSWNSGVRIGEYDANGQPVLSNYPLLSSGSPLKHTLNSKTTQIRIFASSPKNTSTSNLIITLG